jgi:hypothetical protein
MPLQSTASGILTDPPRRSRDRYTLAMPVRRTNRVGWSIPMLLLGAVAWCSGCAKQTPEPASFRIPAAEYAIYFDAARQTLQEYQFDIDRVDARSGVITTQPVAASGWATPWIDHASSFDQATTDLIHRNRRLARVNFSPVDDATNVARSIDPVSEDLRSFEGTIEVSISVLLEEVYRPGRRASPASIRLSSFANDPRDSRIGAEQLQTRTVGVDPALAERMARSFRQIAQNP